MADGTDTNRFSLKKMADRYIEFLRQDLAFACDSLRGAEEHLDSERERHFAFQSGLDAAEREYQSLFNPDDSSSDSAKMLKAVLRLPHGGAICRDFHGGWKIGEFGTYASLQGALEAAGLLNEKDR